jgi:hypothetical protein
MKYMYTHSAVVNVYENVVLENSVASTLGGQLCVLSSFDYRYLFPCRILLIFCGFRLCIS